MEHINTESSRRIHGNMPIKTGKSATYAMLSKEQRRLVDSAEAAMKNTYSPYSHFAVGAALVTDDGTIISGANYENASYGATVCAERTAIFTANNLGYTHIKAMAIMTGGGSPIGPCGLCRQVLYEATKRPGNRDITLFLSGLEKKRIIVTSVKKLLPMAFGPLELGVKLGKLEK